ncbi:MAG TPA: cyclase family protein [Acidimicrobiia bacterium]|jgi:kynurenine formamidase|nr:cyclase family protein [Acidimicrobiia bacterium]
MPLPDPLRELSARVSNWGRWGTDDERGTLNLITSDAVQRGAAAVRQGRVFSLAIPFASDGPQWDSVNMPLRANPKLNTYAVNVSFTGDRADFTTSDDAFSMGSQAATHWDALAHVGYEGKLYNDTDDSVVSAGGASQLGVQSIGAVATRGVLLDVARVHDVDHFDHNYAITADDLDRAVEATRVTIESGDAVLVRTGQMHFLRTGDRPRYSHPSPGLSTDTIAWLRDHDVAAVATDTLTFEVYPCEDPAVFMPVHMIHLRDMGLLQGQVWALDDLAADCATDGQYDFLLCATPLPLTGAVGAPVAPTAIK